MLHIFVAESSVTDYGLLVANNMGSSPFLSLFAFFPGLLSSDSQKPAEPIVRGQAREKLPECRFLLGPYVGSGVTPGAGGTYLAPLPLKPASEISLFEGVNESVRYFLPLAEGKVVHTSE